MAENLCTNCGAPVPEGAAQCPYCNTSLPTQPVAETPVAAVTVHKTANQQTVAFFLGCFGVHDFLLGNPVHGGIKLALTLLSAGVLSWVSAIWALIDMFNMENHKYKCGPGHVLEGKGCIKTCVILLVVLFVLFLLVCFMAGVFSAF